MVIGVTGGYCAGKDTVVRLLERAGYPSIDVDAVGHQVLAQIAPEVTRVFGEGVARADGTIDRGALGAIVFRHPAALRRLEGLLHPGMREIVRAEVEARGRRCVINAAVLFHMGLHELCDTVLCVRAPLLVRLVRARRRDGRGPIPALRRVWSQRGICLKPGGARVDTRSVRNAGSVQDLERVVNRVLDRLRADR